MNPYAHYFKNMPVVTKNLLIINFLIYLLMQLIPAAKEELVMHFAALHYLQSPLFNPAQLFTYMFLHASFTHVFFNMFTLFMFGPQIEWTVGSRRFLFYYISCGVGAALVQEGVFAIMLDKYVNMFSPEDFERIINEGASLVKRGYTYSDPTLAAINILVNGPTVGASGAIYGVLLAYGMIYPNRQIMLLIPPIPVKAKYMVIFWGGAELLLGISGANDNVAHFCHLGGMLIGFFIIWYWKKKGMFNGIY